MPITIARVSDLVTDIDDGLIEMRTPVIMIIVATRASWIQCILFLKEVEKTDPLRSPDALLAVSLIRLMVTMRDPGPYLDGVS